MKNTTIQGQPLTYIIERTKGRKSVQFALLPNGTLQIKAPTQLKQVAIEKLLADKIDWIVKKQQEQAALARNPVNQELTLNAPVLYLGQSYHIIWHVSERDQVYIDGDHLIIQYKPSPSHSTDVTVIGNLLFHWYVEQARSTLSSRTFQWAQRIEVKPSKITIRDQKTRWGSCSSKGSLNYSWRIIMAPSAVIDYLVVHELCHLREPNHSSAFWELVQHYLPDYAEQRKWLAKNGLLLMRLKVISQK